MTGNKVKFGLTLPNRGVIIGATTVAEMLHLAADAAVGPLELQLTPLFAD